MKDKNLVNKEISEFDPFFADKPELKDYQKERILGSSAKKVKQEEDNTDTDNDETETPETEQKKQSYSHSEMDFNDFEINEEEDDDEIDQDEPSGNTKNFNPRVDKEPEFDPQASKGLTDILAPMLLPKIADLSFKFCAIPVKDIEIVMYMHNVPQNVRNGLVEAMNKFNAETKEALIIPPEYIEAFTIALKEFIAYKQITQANPTVTLIAITLTIVMLQITAVIQLRTRNAEIQNFILQQAGIDPKAMNTKVKKTVEPKAETKKEEVK